MFDASKLTEVFIQTTYMLEKSGMIKINFNQNRVDTVKKNNKSSEIRSALNKNAVKVSREGNSISVENSNLTPERIAEIVKKINDNFYNREDVLRVVAERILKSPELQSVIKGK